MMISSEGGLKWDFKGVFDLRVMLQLTNRWHHSSHEVKSAGEVPPRSDRVYTDTGHVRLFVVPEEVVQVFLTQVVLLAEMLEPLRPALLRLSLLRLFQRREDGGATQEIDDDEQRQQQEPRVILVNRTRSAAAAAPACHYVAVVTVVQLPRGTCGMVYSNKAHRSLEDDKSPVWLLFQVGYNGAIQGCGCFRVLSFVVRLKLEPCDQMRPLRHLPRLYS